ncbi:DUF4352 domain-containing protein [Paucisalibacillus globulus]|uniref:DUF4352 domain-containing protein n=1 Tax=Paucisalibacillus globulus TaxID=351095 RepID=UPI00040CDF9B|nr:DUF4352 domain-containing protein [Paucisalibacillus globulus]
MKKLLLVFILGALIIFIAGCSEDKENSEDKGNKTNPSQVVDNGNVESSEEEDKKKIYQIGETAVITSDMYEFDYEVTVNNFELTREFDGVKLEEFLLNAQDVQRFAIVEVTIKNISDRTYIPNDMFSANFSGIDEESGQTSYDEFFTVGDEELAPGDEISGHLVYITSVDYADTFLVKYEVMSEEETQFELPNPEM